MAERSVVARIMRRLNDAGAWASKIHGDPYQIRGLPDVVACFPIKIERAGDVIVLGLFVGIEAKDPKRNTKTTEVQADPIQVYTLKKIAEAGGIVGVVRTEEQLDKLLAIVYDLQQRLMEVSSELHDKEREDYHDADDTSHPQIAS